MSDALKDFRAPDPKPGEDPVLTPPVADDDHSAAPPAEDVVVAGVEPEKKEPAAPPPAPKLSPFDEKRARIADRFSQRREKENENPDLATVNPNDIYGKLAGPGGDPPPEDGAAKPEPDTKAPAEPGPSVLEDKPEPMTLAVNGKTVAKTLAEVAALADMTEDEVKADPARAKKYAQRELATADNLERSRIARRDLPARQPDDVDTRSTRPGPDQDRREAGNDASDRQPASRDTSDDDMAKLIEDIQIGDPKEVAPKLRQMIADAAVGVVKETEGDRARQSELQSNISAVADFLKEQPDLAGKPAVAAAISGKLDEEYRSDLRAVLIDEGETEESADRLLSQASRDHIRNAHLARRLDRHPLVRKIDKAMIADVYEKVRSDFGLTEPPRQQQQPQGLDRQARKEAIPQQPRRASVPPATPPAPPAQLSRRAVVAEMAERTGKRRSTLPR